MPRIRYMKIPAVTLTRDELKQRLADAKKRTKKSLSLRTLGSPVLASKTSGSTQTAAARRKRRICIVLSPFEWSLAFPEDPSSLGGVVCYRG
jgi:hypothetical protein